MLSVRDMLIGSSALQREKRPDLCEKKIEVDKVIRAYFDGTIGEVELYHCLHGRTSFDMMRVTSPDEEFWYVLMAALDVVIEMHPDTQKARRLSHGQITVDDYLSALYPPKKEDRYGW